MEITEAKNNIITLREQLVQVDTELSELKKIAAEHRKKISICENRKKDLSKEIQKLEAIIEAENVFETVEHMGGFDALSQEELLIIFKNMDKTDYRKMDAVRARSGQEIPRWLDLERIVTQVIEMKKLYAGWILCGLSRDGQYDTLPPQTFYKYTYKTPNGHYMSVGGISVVYS
jgi:hypothetical protein